MHDKMHNSVYVSKYLHLALASYFCKQFQTGVHQHQPIQRIKVSDCFSISGEVLSATWGRTSLAPSRFECLFTVNPPRHPCLEGPHMQWNWLLHCLSLGCVCFDMFISLMKKAAHAIKSLAFYKKNIDSTGNLWVFKNYYYVTYLKIGMRCFGMSLQWKSGL